MSAYDTKEDRIEQESIDCPWCGATQSMSRTNCWTCHRNIHEQPREIICYMDEENREYFKKYDEFWKGGKDGKRNTASYI